MKQRGRDRDRGLGDTLGDPTAANGRPGPALQCCLGLRTTFTRALQFAGKTVAGHFGLATLRSAARGPRLWLVLLWASRASFLAVTFAPPSGAAASPAAPGALRG
jgi:hypothetical protein